VPVAYCLTGFRVSSPLLNEKCCYLAESVAGDPTHYMLEQALAQAELEWRFSSFEVPLEDLATALAGLEILGFRGVKLADPFRTPAVDLVGAVTPRSRRAGSANCLTMHDGQLMGDDTYGAALVEAMGGVEAIAGMEVVVIGAGQNARSIAAAVSASEASLLHVVGEEKEEDQLAELAAEIADDGEQTQVALLLTNSNRVEVPQGVRLVVFAPAEGDAPPRLVIDPESASQRMTFVDTRLRGSPTGFLKFAAEFGATGIDGVDLAARENALTLESWTGLEFDRAPLRELAEEFLGV